VFKKVLKLLCFVGVLWGLLLVTANVFAGPYDKLKGKTEEVPSIKQLKEQQGGLPNNVQTNKPILCELSVNLMKRFKDDPDEQQLGRFVDPLHGGIGFIFWNPVSSVVHVVEFPPLMEGTYACLTVFGIEATMETPNKGTKL
tara:strand:+ start:2711 stop:3136 length:426 start_codon:yes stop_codon:yes gene_type:complete